MNNDSPIRPLPAARVFFAFTTTSPRGGILGERGWSKSRSNGVGGGRTGLFSKSSSGPGEGRLGAPRGGPGRGAGMTTSSSGSGSSSGGAAGGGGADGGGALPPPPLPPPPPPPLGGRLGMAPPPPPSGGRSRGAGMMTSSANQFPNLVIEVAAARSAFATEESAQRTFPALESTRPAVQFKAQLQPTYFFLPRNFLS